MEEIDDFSEADALWVAPVYEGSRLKVGAQCLALLRFGGGNRLSYKALKDLFNMERLWFMPKGNKLQTYAMARKLLLRSECRVLKNVMEAPVYDSCPCGKTCYRNPPIRFDPRLERQFADRTDCLFCPLKRYMSPPSLQINCSIKYEFAFVIDLDYKQYCPSYPQPP